MNRIVTIAILVILAAVLFASRAPAKQEPPDVWEAIERLQQENIDQYRWLEHLEHGPEGDFELLNGDSPRTI